MMWGFYAWPRYDWTLSDRRRALARRLRDLAVPVRRIPRWMVSRIDTARSLWPPSM
jgi:hypothetical protein